MGSGITVPISTAGVRAGGMPGKTQIVAPGCLSAHEPECSFPGYPFAVKSLFISVSWRYF